MLLCTFLETKETQKIIFFTFRGWEILRLRKILYSFIIHHKANDQRIYCLVITRHPKANNQRIYLILIRHHKKIQQTKILN